MFPDFADQWTPVVPARAVPRRAPLAVQLAGEPVVLFRTGGRIAALLDRCPHRGVKLSLGRVTPDGHLECPFHGWSFAGDGACADVPLSNLRPEQRDRLAARALPVREIGGLVWARTSLGPAPDEPDVPEALQGDGWARWIHAETWSTHWTRAMENMLDFPHVPFVHRTTIGRGLAAKRRPDSVLRVRLQPTPFGGKIEGDFDGQPLGGLDWRRPNGMVLYLSDKPNRRFRQHVYCVPVGPTTTRMIVVSARDFARRNPFLRLFDEANRFILLQDRRVVESSQPAEVPHPSEEKSVANDGPTLAFRRFYLDTLRAKGDQAPLVPLRRAPMARCVRVPRTLHRPRRGGSFAR
jgi:phenylpropionate dioxygenase-like ring-hydroxylating dioxygenase large terminal subunit